jgi:hypothetical protein
MTDFPSIFITAAATARMHTIRSRDGIPLRDLRVLLAERTPLLLSSARDLDHSLSTCLARTVGQRAALAEAARSCPVCVYLPMRPADA